MARVQSDLVNGQRHPAQAGVHVVATARKVPRWHLHVATSDVLCRRKIFPVLVWLHASSFLASLKVLWAQGSKAQPFPRRTMTSLRRVARFQADEAPDVAASAVQLRQCAAAARGRRAEAVFLWAVHSKSINQVLHVEHLLSANSIHPSTADHSYVDVRHSSGSRRHSERILSQSSKAKARTLRSYSAPTPLLLRSDSVVSGRCVFSVVLTGWPLLGGPVAAVFRSGGYRG